MTKYFLTILTLLHSAGVGQVKLDTKAFGQKILNGQVKYTNENEDKLMKMLDSLFCKTQADKSFYFKTTNKIFQFSDGALSELCSGTSSRYYFEHNLEFINNSLTLSVKDLDRWLEFAAFDIAADEQDIKSLPKIKKRLDNLVSSCKCDASKQALIKKYNATLYKKIEFNLKDP
jgi:hypothetical protein